MKHDKTPRAAWSKGAKRCAMAGALILMAGCGATIPVGDAGCASYREARLAMPDAPLGSGPWPEWVADLDDRMTGACT